MREYLKSIGFSDLESRYQINHLLQIIKENSDRKTYFQLNEKECICS